MNTTRQIQSFNVDAMDFHNRVTVPLGNVSVRVNERVRLYFPSGSYKEAVVCQVRDNKASLCLC